MNESYIEKSLITSLPNNSWSNSTQGRRRQYHQDVLNQSFNNSSSSSSSSSYSSSSSSSYSSSSSSSSSRNTYGGKNLYNYTSYKLTTGTSSADYIYNNGYNAKVNGASGNDTIANYGNYASLNGGGGNDSINAGYNTTGVTLCGGLGNDTLTGSNSTYSGDVFQFGNYDGNNVITNYGTNDTIHLKDTYYASSIHSSIRGSDKIISVGSYGGTTITLKGAAYNDGDILCYHSYRTSHIKG